MHCSSRSAKFARKNCQNNGQFLNQRPGERKPTTEEKSECRRKLGRATETNEAFSVRRPRRRTNEGRSVRGRRWDERPHTIPNGPRPSKRWGTARKRSPRRRMARKRSGGTTEDPEATSRCAWQRRVVRRPPRAGSTPQRGASPRRPTSASAGCVLRDEPTASASPDAAARQTER